MAKITGSKHRITLNEETFQLFQLERNKRGLSGDDFLLSLLTKLNESQSHIIAPLRNRSVGCQTESVPMLDLVDKHTETDKKLFQGIAIQTDVFDFKPPTKTYERQPRPRPVSHITYGLAVESPQSTPEKQWLIPKSFSSTPTSPLTTKKSLRSRKLFNLDRGNISPIKKHVVDIDDEDPYEDSYEDFEPAFVEDKNRLASAEEQEVLGDFEDMDVLEDSEENELNFSHTFTDGDITNVEEFGGDDQIVEEIESEMESLIIEPIFKTHSEPIKHNVKDSFALVHHPTLLALLKKAYGRRCAGCSEQLNYETKLFGTAIHVSYKCSGPGSDAKRHTKGKWMSQPLFHGLHSGNLVVASCIPLSGNLYGKIALFMRHSKIFFFKQDTYYKLPGDLPRGIP